MEKKVNYFINLSFIGYFVVLLVERIMCFINSYNQLGIELMFQGSKFNLWTFAISGSLVVLFLLFFIIFCNKSIAAIFKSGVKVSFIALSIGAAMLLVASMVDTPNTNQTLQFIAYGILIFGLILKGIVMAVEQKSFLFGLLCTVFIIALSMTIPVVHRVYLLNPSATYNVRRLFYAFNLGAAGLASLLFGIILIAMFMRKYNVFSSPFLVLTILGLSVGVLIWKTKILEQYPLPELNENSGFQLAFLKYADIAAGASYVLLALYGLITKRFEAEYEVKEKAKKVEVKKAEKVQPVKEAKKETMKPAKLVLEKGKGSVPFYSKKGPKGSTRYYDPKTGRFCKEPIKIN